MSCVLKFIKQGTDGNVLDSAIIGIDSIFGIGEINELSDYDIGDAINKVCDKVLSGQSSFVMLGLAIFTLYI